MESSSSSSNSGQEATTINDIEPTTAGDQAAAAVVATPIPEFSTPAMPAPPVVKTTTNTSKRKSESQQLDTTADSSPNSNSSPTAASSSIAAGREKRIRKIKAYDDDFVTFGLSGNYASLSSYHSSTQSSAEHKDQMDQQLAVESNRYNVGDLVWAKLSGYPWWPGMINNSMNTTAISHAKYVGTTRPKLMFYVEFFGSLSESAWISSGCLLDYKSGGEETFRKHVQELVDQANTKSSKEKMTEKYMLRVRQSKREGWESAVNEAEEALQMDVDERRNAFEKKNVANGGTVTRKPLSKLEEGYQSGGGGEGGDDDDEILSGGSESDGAEEGRSKNTKKSTTINSSKSKRPTRKELEQQHQIGGTSSSSNQKLIVDHNNNGWFSHKYHQFDDENSYHISSPLVDHQDDDDDDSIQEIDVESIDPIPPVLYHHHNNHEQIQRKPKRTRRKRRLILCERANDELLPLSNEVAVVAASAAAAAVAEGSQQPETYLIDRYAYAVRHIRQGVVSVDEACNMYRISRTALERCLSGGKAPRGKKTRLNEHEENELVEWLIDSQDIKYNEAIHRVFERIESMFRRENKPNPFRHNGGKPSMDWWYDFLARHPQVMASKPDWLKRGKVNDQYILDVQSGKLRCTKFRRALLSAIQYIKSLNDAATNDLTGGAIASSSSPWINEEEEEDQEDDLNSVRLDDLIMNDDDDDNENGDEMETFNNTLNSDLDKVSESIIDDLDEMVTSLVGKLDHDVSMFYNQSSSSGIIDPNSFHQNIKHDPISIKSMAYCHNNYTNTSSNSRLLVQDEDDDLIIEDEINGHFIQSDDHQDTIYDESDAAEDDDDDDKDEEEDQDEMPCRSILTSFHHEYI